MVKLTQYTARLALLCVLWLLVRFTQYLLQVCDRRRDADEVSNAELYLQCDIREMVKSPILKLVES